jgi:hypothetical protein
MAGRGKAPKPPEQRRTGHVPQRGDWVATPGVGWQHGPLPPAPTRLLKASKETWDVWFAAWFAAHWGPQDLPMLGQVIRLFDRVERGSATAAERTELRQLSDSYGITPKGQQDRRWTAPKDDTPSVSPGDQAPAEEPGGRYGHLRAVTKAG